MYNSNIKTLIAKLKAIEKLNEPINNSYSDIINNIELAEDYNIDFRHTLELNDEDFYINIKKIDEKTKLIKNYAVGIANRIKKTNKLRHDDEDHHNNKKTVKEMNPPHHKHEGDKERVKGISGNINDLINGYKDILN